MGNGSSRQQSAHNLPEEENSQLNVLPPVGVAVDVRALRAYEKYVANLSSLDLYKFDFTFSHLDAYGLTEHEFHAMMDSFKVPKTSRYGDKAKYVFAMYTEGETIKKSLIIFVRSEAQTYDVLTAEVTMQGGLNKNRLAVAGGTTILLSGALCFLNPAVGLLSSAVCTIIVAGKAVYEKSHHDFRDVTIGYMIKQLIDANILVVTSRNELAFIHNGQETPLSH